MPVWGERLLVHEVLVIQRVALGGAEAGVADDAAQLLFRGAVGDAGGAHHVLLKHHRTDVVAAEAQTELADLAGRL